MSSYDASSYGNQTSALYDHLYPGKPAENNATAELISDLARRSASPSFLELGIGTGRVALGVHERGVRVCGIDGSPEMVDHLHQKPGGENIDVVIGDYRDTHFSHKGFSVAALIFNGIFDPRGRTAQIDIFHNAAWHLTPGGYFVVESWVMSDQQRNGEWSIMPRYVDEQQVEIQLARYDIETNTIERTLMHIRPQGTEFVTVKDTYASPGELDLMAEMAGFTRAERYSNWNRDPFTASSSKHIGVYQLRDAL